MAGSSKKNLWLVLIPVAVAAAAIVWGLPRETPPSAVPSTPAAPAKPPAAAGPGRIDPSVLDGFYAQSNLRIPPEECRPERPDLVAPLQKVVALLMDGEVGKPRPDNERALQMLEQDLGHEGLGYGEVWLLKAWAMHLQGAPTEQVLQTLEQATVHCDELCAAYYLRGQILAANNKLALAVGALKRAIATGEGYGDPQVALAQVYLRKGDKPRALARLNELIQDIPEFAPGYRERGAYHLKEGALPEAIADLSRAAELAPKDGKAFLMLGKAHLKAHNEAKASAAMCAAKALGEASAARLCPTVP